MATDVDDLEGVSVVGDSDSASEVVAVSPAVRKFLLAGVAVLGGILGVTLIAALLSDDPPEEVGEEPTLLITSTTITEATAPTTTLVDQPVTTTEATTTTSAAPVEPAAIFAAEPSRTELVLWNFNDQRVIVVDVDRSVTRELDMTDFGVPLVERIVASGDRLVIQSLGDYYAVATNGVRNRLDTRGIVQTIGDDEVWVTEAFIGDQPVTPFRIDFDGERRELPELPGDIFPFAWFEDRLLVGGGRTGGVYIETGDHYERLTSGELLAGRNGFLLTRVCNAVLDCSINRVDLVTGVVTTHTVPPGFSMTGLWWLDDATSPNLDAVLGVSDELGAPALWDLTTGDVQPLAIGQGRGATFSPDGRWVFVSVADDVLAYHRESGVEVRLPIPGGLDAPNGLQLAALPLG